MSECAVCMSTYQEQEKKFLQNNKKKRPKTDGRGEMREKGEKDAEVSTSATLLVDTG